MRWLPTAALAIAILAGSAQAQDVVRPKANAAKQLKQGAALERFLSLPPERQRRLLQQMTPERRQQALALLNALQLLSEDERASLQGRFQAFAGLDRERRQAVRKEIQILRLMTPEDRRKRLADIKPRFSGGEMQILYGVAGQPEPQE
ncbi:MAG: DUF3106 domain-containing protein [Acidobacteriota bacterium]